MSKNSRNNQSLKDKIAAQAKKDAQNEKVADPTVATPDKPAETVVDKADDKPTVEPTTPPTPEPSPEILQSTIETQGKPTEDTNIQSLDAGNTVVTEVADQEAVEVKPKTVLELAINDYLEWIPAIQNKFDRDEAIKKFATIIRVAISENDAPTVDTMLNFFREYKSSLLAPEIVFNNVSILTPEERNVVATVYTLFTEAVAALGKTGTFNLDPTNLKNMLPEAGQIIGIIIAKLER